MLFINGNQEQYEWRRKGTQEGVPLPRPTEDSFEETAKEAWSAEERPLTDSDKPTKVGQLALEVVEPQQDPFF